MGLISRQEGRKAFGLGGGRILSTEVCSANGPKSVSYSDILQILNNMRLPKLNEYQFHLLVIRIMHLTSILYFYLCFGYSKISCKMFIESWVKRYIPLSENERDAIDMALLIIRIMDHILDKII